MKVVRRAFPEIAKLQMRREYCRIGKERNDERAQESQDQLYSKSGDISAVLIHGNLGF